VADGSEERVTPGGVSRALDVDEEARLRRQRGRRATLVSLIVGVLVAAVVGGIALLGPQFRSSPPTDDDFPPGDGAAGFLAVIGGREAAPVGREPELLLRDLADVPADTTAIITVIAANGKSTTMYTTAPDRVSGGGGLAFRGDQELGARAAALGPAPYRYSVSLNLDDAVYVGTGSWPDDVVTGSEPFVALDFDPPLPEG
jgi:hypothetical protein